MSVGDVLDPTEAVAFFLKPAMSEAFEGRIFAPAMPTVRNFNPPCPALVVMPAGGGKLYGGTRMPVYDSLVDILCYGGSRDQADTLGRECQELLRVLKYAFVECPEAEGNGLLHWARIASGVNPREEPQVNWSFVEFTIQLSHAALVLP